MPDTNEAIKKKVPDTKGNFFKIKKMLMVYLVLIGLIVAVIWCWQKYGSAADEFFSFPKIKIVRYRHQRLKK